MNTPLQKAATALMDAMVQTDFTCRLGEQLDALEKALEAEQAQAMEPVKRWPFDETPGEFTARLQAAYDSFGSMLAAVRCVLIEEPPVLTHPAPPATGEPLSEVQIVDWMWGRDLNRLHENQREQVFLLIRDVEAHHKIGASS